MAIRDFIQKLAEQDDSNIIYSKTPKESIKVILPNVPDQSYSKEDLNKNQIKVLPPREEKRVIKFKISSSQKDKLLFSIDEANAKKEMSRKVPASEQKTEQKLTINRPDTTVLTQNKKIEDEQKKIEDLFSKTETPLSKKEIWIEKYHKAMASKKDSWQIRKIREGRFTITDQNEILFLSDYVTADKSVREVLKDKWI